MQWLLPTLSVAHGTIPVSLGVAAFAGLFAVAVAVVFALVWDDWEQGR